MCLTIEKATAADIDELEDLYDTLNDYLAANVNYPGWMKGVYPIREDAEAGIRKEKLYVAREGGRIAGAVILNHEPEEAYHGAPWGSEDDYDNLFVIHTFAVHPNYLKRGVGRKLLDYSLELAKRNRIKAVRLDVYEKNEPAIHLYESCGFRYVDTVDLGYGNYGLDWFKLYELIL